MQNFFPGRQPKPYCQMKKKPSKNINIIVFENLFFWFSTPRLALFITFHMVFLIGILKRVTLAVLGKPENIVHWNQQSYVQILDMWSLDSSTVISVKNFKF